MKTRILSAVVLAPLLILLLVLGGGWLKATVMLLSMVGMFEFYRAMDRPFRPLHLVGYLCGVIYLIGIECFIYTPGWFPILISVFLVVLLAAMVAFHHTVHIRDILVTFFGFFYVCFLLSHIYL
ncbi:MAG TPA: phosphatidate cytidylyltransferase, partial [Firmicutes bacterium]|nr:phosphatidate cytidylyltransferase [Bacillota bacterium]